MNAAIFLDRDNTLIYADGDVADPSQVRLLQGVPSAIASLRGLGYKIVVVTNQDGIANGRYSEEATDAVHMKINEQIGAISGTSIDRFYYCPFHPDAILERYRKEHAWRKPNPGMIQQAAKDLDLDLMSSWIISADPSDIRAGYAAGVRSMLLTHEAPELIPLKLEETFITQTRALLNKEPDGPYFAAKSLIEAVRIIAQQRRPDFPEERVIRDRFGRKIDAAANRLRPMPALQAPPIPAPTERPGSGLFTATAAAIPEPGTVSEQAPSSTTESHATQPEQPTPVTATTPPVEPQPASQVQIEPAETPAEEASEQPAQPAASSASNLTGHADPQPMLLSPDADELDDAEPLHSPTPVDVISERKPAASLTHSVDATATQARPAEPSIDHTSPDPTSAASAPAAAPSSSLPTQDDKPDHEELTRTQRELTQEETDQIQKLPPVQIQMQRMESSIRQILAELRSNREVVHEMPFTTVLGLVLQGLALVCLLGALFVGAGSTDHFIRWVLCGVMLQLGSIASILTRR